MSIQLVIDGKDPLTAPVLAYLEQLGVPAHLIKRIQLDSPHNDVQLVTVTLLVDPETVRASPRLVPLLDVPMRDEQPRTAPQRVQWATGPDARPGSDGDTTDWPTDLIPRVTAHNDRISHAPQICQTCNGVAVWREASDRLPADHGSWVHTSGPNDHAAQPAL